MSAATILTLYLVFFGLRLFWEGGLSVLNQRHVRRVSESPPPFVRQIMDEGMFARSVDYTLSRSSFSLASGLFSSAFLLVIVLSGALGALDEWVAGWGMGTYTEGLVYFFLISALFTAVSIPFSLYSQFVIEERFGFNKMTLGLYVLDTLKSALVSVVLFTPLIFGLFWFMDRAGSLWWVYGFLGVAVFQMIIMIVYPTVIAPLFNKFRPLEEGTLRDRINELAERLSFKTRGIFVMDGSKRSRHSNAYFTGLGGAKRVVLFDTLIETLGEGGLLAVLGHEIGHEKKHHIRYRLLVSLGSTLLGFWILSLLLGYGPFYTAFGFTRTSYHAILVILSFCAGPFTFYLKPLFAVWSRRHEYQADRFAVDVTGSAEDMKAALITMSQKNLSNLTPHPLYSFYHYSHPTLSERLTAMESYAGRGS